MKKTIWMLVVIALLLCPVALSETDTAVDYSGSLEINTLIESGSFIIQIPVAADDAGWMADDMAGDDSVVTLYDADIIEDTFVVRYDAVADGDATVGVRHYYSASACDRAMTWDLHVENGAVTEVLGGSQSFAADEGEITPSLAGEWQEKETQFTRMTVEKNPVRGWDICIVSPMTHGAYVFKTSILYDCYTDSFVYDKGKYWDLPADYSADTALGEAKVAGSVGAFSFMGDGENLLLSWADDQHPEEEIVFAPIPVEETRFAQWNADAPALKALIEYVEAVTNPDSEDFIPEADRIATFDMDGTLCAELNPTYLEYYLLARRILADPSYKPDSEMLEFGRMLRDHALDRSFPDGMDMLHATHAAKAYAGMTLNEFADFVTRQLLREADGFEGMTYAETIYQPMVEVVEYLQDNGFKCYVVSGSDRFICRTFIEGLLDIPYENIIGMDVQLEATNQGDEDGLKYVYNSDDVLIRTDNLVIKNLKTNKVFLIAREIGRQPVLSFGNSGGDTAMHNFALYNNPYRSEAFMLIADDEVRDYGNAEKVAPLKEKWEESGYNVISMANDWKTIYGEDVVKTNEFHWLEDLAENIVPEDAADTTESATTEDVQYVMYLGTNDKDTNQPVFTEAEALERAKEILIRHFGGYTIQEANGGWIDGDTEYQEYTLVIYLSDTTVEKVHAAADELVKVFNQNSVLIQTNPTMTEFYSGAAQ